ncbi:MAG TPA: FprA family A-type flavoprotein [Methanomassiliicoccales archaeon]|nr:FprA family A-type flavoprotein [Methanomassiliicoccales archaeon]
MEVRELAKGIYWVGIRDWNRRLFDGLIPLPYGTTYNAYLVQGKDATALIDSTNPGFEGELRSNIEEILPIKDIDYLVMNHAEPDHANAIPFLLENAPEAKLVLTQQGAKIAGALYHPQADRVMTVKEGDVLDLGGKRLRFIEAPFLHWPETMFTYAEEDKMLFPCDFTGAHTAAGDFAREIPDYEWIAKKYFGEIMMPFAKNGRNAIEKIDKLEIEMICPSHGPMHDDPKWILGLYRNWTAGRTVRKVVVAYISMWGSTEALVKSATSAMLSEGIDVRVYNLAESDVASLAGDLVDADGIVLGAPTVLGQLHPLGLYAAAVVKAFKPPARFGVLLSSYGWGGGAAKQATEILGQTKIQLIGALDINGRPSDADLQKAAELGKLMAGNVKERPEA